MSGSTCASFRRWLLWSLRARISRRRTSGRYLELTYSDGRIVAGYLYLDRRPGDKAARSEEREAGLVVDFATDGRAIGIEITAPSVVTVNDINNVLASVGKAAMTSDETRPLRAA